MSPGNDEAHLRDGYLMTARHIEGLASGGLGSIQAYKAMKDRAKLHCECNPLKHYKRFYRTYEDAQRQHDEIMSRDCR